MPRDPGSPEEWLRYARSDLALARGPATRDVMLESLCFHAQQAAEKSLKAVLVKTGVSFPKVHSIERLIDLLPPSVSRVPVLIAAAKLTGYATTFRYPGMEEPVTQEQYQEALGMAADVVDWAAHQIESDTPS